MSYLENLETFNFENPKFEEVNFKVNNSPALNKKSKMKKTTSVNDVYLTIKYIMDTTDHNEYSIAEILETDNGKINSILDKKQKTVKVEFDKLVKKKFPQSFKEALLIKKEAEIFKKFTTPFLSLEAGKEIRIIVKRLFRNKEVWTKLKLTQKEHDAKVLRNVPNATPMISRFTAKKSYENKITISLAKTLYNANAKVALEMIPILKESLLEESKDIETKREKQDTMMEDIVEIKEALVLLERNNKANIKVELFSLLNSIKDKRSGTKNKSEIAAYDEVCNEIEQRVKDF